MPRTAQGEHEAGQTVSEPEVSADASSARGACIITVDGSVSCIDDVTEKTCFEMADQLGGSARFVPGGDCGASPANRGPGFAG